MNTVIVASLLLLAPLLLAALGGLIHNASGVVNIGLEGGMLAGALIGVAVSATTSSWALGLLVAGVGSGILTWLMTLVITRLKANEIIVGLGFNIVIAGIIGFILKWKMGVSGTLRLDGVDPLPRWDIPGIRDVPVLGALVSGKDVLFWLALLLVPVTIWVLRNTRYGLRLRSAGDAPAAAGSLGVRVLRIRESAGFIAGTLAGLGGAHLSLGQVGLFNDQMVAGRGFIALAAFYFGRNKPLPTAVACLLFAFFDALQVSIQIGSSLGQLLNTLPYVIVIVALAVTGYQSRLKSRRAVTA